MRGTGYNIRTKKGRVKRQVLADVIRRVVEAAQPDKIVLFGSAARGEMGPNSDLEFVRRQHDATRRSPDAFDLHEPQIARLEVETGDVVAEVLLVHVFNLTDGSEI